MVRAGLRQARPRLDSAAPTFAALGDPQRLRMLVRLSREGPQSITSLAAGVEISHQAVSKHLRTLERARLVSSARSGRERIWTLERNGFTGLQSFLAEISGQWDRALETLRRMVEED